VDEVFGIRLVLHLSTVLLMLPTARIDYLPSGRSGNTAVLLAARSVLVSTPMSRPSCAVVRGLIRGSWR
jgi:hypothetical protein